MSESELSLIKTAKNNPINSKKNTNSEHENFLKYHTFMIRDSYLDVLFENSNINKSEFKGFFNLGMSLLIIYVFTLPIYNLINHGHLIKTKVFERMVNDFSVLLIVWPLFHFWTYFAYFHQILILNRFSALICNILEYLIIVGLFLITTVICLFTKMCTTHILFTLAQSMIHLFKIISYMQVNRDYRQDYLERKNKNISNNVNYTPTPLSSYPKNINFSNFFYFLKAPTFIYEESYPMRPCFRVNYFILKLLKAFFLLTILYYIYTEHIELTISLMLKSSIIELLIRLYLPVCLSCLSLFYLIFECVLPGYAEIAQFGDRQFYDDWWNSTDLEEFNRKWNKIVHQFLYRHVYLECNKRMKFSPLMSKAITFFVSAFLHEFCLCLIIKLFRPYLFCLMMLQVPLILIGKKFLKNTTGGNYFFWFSMLLGTSLIFILYNTAYLSVYGYDY